ncbi:MAG: hypothetical protein AAFW70_22980 [Cyanobacteria bacterium J06635_10]
MTAANNSQAYLSELCTEVSVDDGFTGKFIIGNFMEASTTEEASFAKALLLSIDLNFDIKKSRKSKKSRKDINLGNILIIDK